MAGFRRLLVRGNLSWLKTQIMTTKLNQQVSCFRHIGQASRPTVSSKMVESLCNGRSLYDRWPSFLASPCLCCRRSYSKKVKKEKSVKGKSGSKAKVDLSDEELSEVIDMEGYKSQLQQILHHQREDFIKHLTLRTTAGVFESIVVDTTDGRFPINQLGQVAQKTPYLVMINLSASPQYLPAVREAISQSGMNVNPQQEANVLYVPIPKVTKEHRENLAKSAKNICDKTKEKLRDIHNKHSRKLKQAKSTHSEDLIKNVQDVLLSTMHDFSTEAETMMHAKQSELLGGK